MDQIYTADRLRPEEARAAFALVTLRLPYLDLAEWTRDVRRKSGPRTGFMVVRDLRGIFHAIYRYRTQSAYGKGSCLEICEPVIANLPGSPIEAVVADSIESLAAENGCKAIRLNVIVRPAKGSTLGTSVIEAARAAGGTHRVALPSP